MRTPVLKNHPPSNMSIRTPQMLETALYRWRAMSPLIGRNWTRVSVAAWTNQSADPQPSGMADDDSARQARCDAFRPGAILGFAWIDRALELRIGCVASITRTRSQFSL
jgi:hypothetical protein